MGESSDYEPSSYWSGHDFTEAKHEYDSHAGRSYDQARRTSKGLQEVLMPKLRTTSKRPLVILPDLTGSMSKWPTTIFSKLPYLEHQLKNVYLGDDMEVAFIGIGDTKCDDYPLQSRPFSKAANIKAELEELVIEGGGGRNSTESYEMGGLYLCRNVEMPSDAKPVAIFIGDEVADEEVSRSKAEKFGIAIQDKYSIKEIFEELNRRWSVYFVQKVPTGNGGNTDSEVHQFWANLVGEGRIAELQEPERIVDVIFGILGKETEKEDYFREEITRRQTPKQVETVYRALKNILAGSKLNRLPGTVVPKLGTSGKKATPLLTKKK